MLTDIRNAFEVGVRARRIGIPLVGESEQFLKLLQIVERVARHANATVLIRGETGTGKELIARATHYLGARCNFPFVPVNCGALPESLAENELFGHRSGAFTGARDDAVGLVRLAHNGTLFLDEVNSLPVKAQVGLLRFLQDGHFRPLGAAREETANARVIAACNSGLEGDIRAGRFRQDLYYRLNVLSIDVPALRTRSGDIPVLARHFIQEYARRYDLPQKSLHASTVASLERYAWPGNVRELENLVHREYLLCDDHELRIEAPDAVAPPPAPTPEFDTSTMTYRAAKCRMLEEFDRAYLVELLRRTGGNVTRAAQLAGKERRAFGKLLKRYHLGHGRGAQDSGPES